MKQKLEVVQGEGEAFSSNSRKGSSPGKVRQGGTRSTSLNVSGTAAQQHSRQQDRASKAGPRRVEPSFLSIGGSVA